VTRADPRARRVGERLEEFDDEPRHFNRLLTVVLNAAFAAVGAWPARRR
jgi:hypothetical protein